MRCIQWCLWQVQQGKPCRFFFQLSFLIASSVAVKPAESSSGHLWCCLFHTRKLRLFLTVANSVLPNSCSGVKFTIDFFFAIELGCLMLLWLLVDRCFRGHIHITNQDHLVTSSSHVQTRSATHCTKTWVQQSNARSCFNVTTHSHMQMDHLLVRSWPTSSLYPWPSPPLTVLTSQSGTPMRCNILYMITAQWFFLKASYFCLWHCADVAMTRGWTLGK